MDHLEKPGAWYLNHLSEGWGKKRQGWDSGHCPYWALDLGLNCVLTVLWMAYFQSFLRPRSWLHQNPGWSIWGVMKEQVCCHDLPMCVWISISLLQRGTGNKAPSHVALTYTEKASSGLFCVCFSGIRAFLFSLLLHSEPPSSDQQCVCGAGTPALWRWPLQKHLCVPPRVGADSAQGFGLVFRLSPRWACSYKWLDKSRMCSFALWQAEVKATEELLQTMSLRCDSCSPAT